MTGLSIINLDKIYRANLRICRSGIRAPPGAPKRIVEAPEKSGVFFIAFLEIIVSGVIDLVSDDIQELKEHIQQLRRELSELIENHRLTDPEVIGASQILDALMVEYESCKPPKFGMLFLWQKSLFKVNFCALSYRFH